MKKIQLISLIIAFLFSVNAFCQPVDIDGSPTPVKAAYNLLNRIIPGYSKDFHLFINEAGNNKDEFEVEASNGIVTITGSSAIALTKGIYFYLRNAANCMITWNGNHIDLPKVLPDFAKTKINTPYEYRLYYNVCTYGYTTAFWDWNQWEKEIDWMALHGINMPIAMIGQEEVWQKVWKSLGITDEELSNYFSGPAFLPWHRMGNINKHGGPIPQSYIDKSAELQKKILNRMRELGMNPVVPAFSGYVPSSFKRIYPNADIITMKPWAGFPADNGTFMLSPLSKHFAEIGKKFIEEYSKEFGQSHLYLADAFNEMTVPVSKDNRYKELADFGKAIFNSINSADSTGTWVMQGWLFYSDATFWDKPSTQALLKDVPDKRMIIIDLAEESFQGWKKLDGFFGKRWIYSVIHNYGGHNQLFGNLPFDAKDPSTMLADSSHGDMAGFGISPEGVENNEIVYELLSDVAWTDKPINLNKWIEDYCSARYGKYPEQVLEAWMYLLKTVYSTNGAFPHDLFQFRPKDGLKSDLEPNDDLDKATDLFLSGSESLKGNSLYTADAIQIAVEFASSKADQLLDKAIGFHKKNEFNKRDIAFDKAFTLISKVDELLSAHPLYRINRWIDFARSWGKDEKEADFYEENAKRQITTWGGPYLTEYASKIWSGLVKNYYLPRWEKFADSLKTGAACDLFNWEEKWITTPVKHFDEAKPDNPVQFAKDLVSEAKKDQQEVSQ
ncbi:MAG: alpha-N-acetylglucosaminidase [Ignavibacteriaceae bacterium]|nr:alpha-N-acetylglucosaminidase [Ignavibacteriaceae bacterium]